MNAPCVTDTVHFPREESSPNVLKFASTPESATHSEITGLAIVETLVAIAVSLLLVQALDSVAHIVAGALVAPFFLLRTEASVAAAYRLFDAAFLKLAPPMSFLAGLYDRLPPLIRSLTFFVILLPLVSLSLVLIRCIATILTVIASPREAVLAIPGNWLRTTLATDSSHPPEFLPAAETATEAPATVQMLRYREVRRRLMSEVSTAFWGKLRLLAILVPAAIFRLFLKSTSLVYFPLIWVSGVPLTAKGILSLPLERVRRCYAYIVLLITLSPLLVSFHLQDALPTVQDRAVLTYVLPMGEINWWHITRVAAVVVTVALYFYARRLNAGVLQHPERERLIIGSANRLRAVCGVFTMGCFLAIVLAF